MSRAGVEIVNDLVSLINRYQGSTVEETARAIYSSLVPDIADRIRPEIQREERKRLIEDGWKEPTDLSMLTRTALIEVAVAEMTKKLIEYPSTQYTEDNVGNLCEGLKALEISKRIDREEQENKDD